MSDLTSEQIQAEQSTYLATAEEVKAIFAKLKTKPANKVSKGLEDKRKHPLSMGAWETACADTPWHIERG